MNQLKRQYTYKTKQTGLGLISMLFIGGILAVAGVVIAQIVPTVIEYQSIIQAAHKSKVEASVSDVRRAFDKNKAAGYFDAISGQDLDITKEGDKNVVRFSYNKEIHLAGPAYLVMKYVGEVR